ncbi:MAG TPA: hypothetical protein V6C78_05910 [Crinalium sp.]
MSTLNLNRYLTYYYILPKEGSPDTTQLGTREHSDRFSSHATEALRHIRRLRGI